jgi:hypothetical protein
MPSYNSVVRGETACSNVFCNLKYNRLFAKDMYDTAQKVSGDCLQSSGAAPVIVKCEVVARLFARAPQEIVRRRVSFVNLITRIQIEG